MSELWRYIGGTAGALALGAATTATVYWATRPSQFPCAVDLDEQAHLVPGTDSAVSSRVCKDGELMENIYEDGHTFYEAFQRGSRVSNNGKCLGFRPSGQSPYCWISYNDVILKAHNLGSGLILKGLAADNNTRIGIYSQNRVEYIVTALACASYSMVIVPLYDTLGPDSCTHIINQAEIKLVVCDTNQKIKSLLSHYSQTPGLKVIVCVEPLTGESQELAQKAGVELITYSEVEQLGNGNLQKVKPCRPDDMCTVCYTSGTTGPPKGAMITHKNLMSVVSAITKQLETMVITPDDTMVSYLPLAHMYQTMNETCMYLNGAKVGFYQGSVKLLMDDIAELKPTVFPTVPRLLNRIYDKVMSSVSSNPAKKYMMEMAVSIKSSEIERGIIRDNSIWDKLVFKKVQQSLGGRCRLITTGSAPVSPRVLSFMRCAAGCVVIEGYGQTECAAVATLQMPGESGTGQVGCPLACNMIKVVDVPDMNYFAKDNQGEVCIKGPNVFSGYFKMPEKTAETLDKDGWLHTGDIGIILPNGTLKIVDRKKNIFKIAQGEYISPEKIETIYLRSSTISQVFVHGESLKSCLVAVAVPDPEVLPKWAEERLGVSGNMVELCCDPDVKKAVLEDLNTVGKNAGLLSFEQAKDIYLHPEPFNIENGLLTPTLKTKRTEVAKHFAKQVQVMYSRLQ